MHFPFSFWKTSGFNPQTLSLDWYQTPNYPGAGVAWPGTASAGTSGSHSDLAGTNTTGSTLNGHITMNSTGGSVSQGAQTLDNYILTASFSGSVLFNVAGPAPADQGAGSRVLNASLMSANTGNCFGVTFSTVGVTFWILSSFVGYVEQTFACPTGSWHDLQFVYDGSNITSRLDSGSWAAPAAVVSGFNGTALNTVSWRFGSSGFSAVNATFDAAEAFLSKSQLSTVAAGDFDNYISYVNSKYGLAL